MLEGASWIVVLVALVVQELISELLQTNKDKYHFKFERIGSTCDGIITAVRQLFSCYQTLIPALLAPYALDICQCSRPT